MALTLYNHRIYCITEGQFVYKWTESADPLTSCPNDPGHTTQPGSESTVEVRAPTQTQIVRDLGSRNEGALNTVFVTALPGTTTTVKTWPIQVAIYDYQLAVDATNAGDEITVEIDVDGQIATLAQPALAGDTVLYLTDVSAARIGRYVTLSSGGTSQLLKRVTAINAVVKTITVEQALTTGFPVGTQVLQVHRPVQAFKVVASTSLSYIVNAPLPVVVLPAGRELRVIYTNSGLVTKSFALHVYYGY